MQAQTGKRAEKNRVRAGDNEAKVGKAEGESRGTLRYPTRVANRVFERDSLVLTPQRGL